ncbi:hypothetical protein [Methylocapsa acidiphila]|uniref:hypothetical protein n=1 Tax=Methylocapsa acidiphila TaxID=133552 RepID=UPI0012EB6C1F|nr:hypothetical protein [Methylocapsa acidiphila]
MIDDAEIRGWLLKHFHRLRDANDGWCQTDEIILSPHPVSRPAISNACEHLADAGYIRWELFNHPIGRLAIGRAKITGTGIDVVTDARAPSIDIRFPGMGECGVAPSYLASARSPQAEEKKNELLTLKPSFWGMSLDLKEACRRVLSWWKEQK